MQYEFEAEALDNKYMHLTNVAVQKLGDEYNSAHGNKWALSKLRLWLEGTQGAQYAATACHAWSYCPFLAMQQQDQRGVLHAKARLD